MGSMACCTNRSLYTVNLVETYGLEYNVSDLPQPDPDLSAPRTQVQVLVPGYKSTYPPLLFLGPLFCSSSCPYSALYLLLYRQRLHLLGFDK
jgi:hypothetical protein